MAGDSMCDDEGADCAYRKEFAAFGGLKACVLDGLNALCRHVGDIEDPELRLAIKRDIVNLMAIAGRCIDDAVAEEMVWYPDSEWACRI